MKTFLGIHLPSQALTAMCDGLEEQSQRPDFKVNMKVFGDVAQGICFGCAATCALQKLANINFTPRTILAPTRHRQIATERVGRIICFEAVIDRARVGDIYPIFEFFDLYPPNIPLPNWCLTTDAWRAELPKVRKYITKLQKLGY